MIPQSSSDQSEFSLSQARSIVQDLFQPNALVYWCDYLSTYILAIFCFRQVRGGGLTTIHQGFTGEWTQVIWFIASCLLFYRAGMFIHELVHQRNSDLFGFHFVWNLLSGVPFLTPSFVYDTHFDHHRRAQYGTKHDGEYLPLLHCRWWYTLFYLSWSLVIPILVIVRFSILTPLAWCVPKLRTTIHRRCSSLVMDPTYIRTLPTNNGMRIIYLQEFLCLLWCWGIVLVPVLLMNRFPWPFIVHAYLTSVFIVSLNALRTLGSHRWTNRGDEMSFTDQVWDSVNYPHAPILSEVWGPIGTRFHALHHLFPSMPYHALGTAHRRLMRELPADSIYRTTEAKSLTWTIMSLLRTARTNLNQSSQISRGHN